MRKRADEVAQLAGMDPEVRGQRLANEVAMIWLELADVSSLLDRLLIDFERHYHRLTDPNTLTRSLGK